MKLLPDFPTQASPEGLEVYQLTDGVQTSHVYTEAQVFTPDSTRLVLHRHGHPHGGDVQNPLRQYVLCDLSSGGEISPLTQEPGAIAPCISPNGKYFYYFVDQTQSGERRLLLKRFSLETGERETVMALEGNIPGTNQAVLRPSMLATIRQDGEAVALHAALHGQEESYADFGLIVCDLKKAEFNLVLRGPSWCNMHAQYCRSSDAPRDILVQENHGCAVAADGSIARLVGKPGCDIHVIRDDGSNFRTLAWGRDEAEECRGHQCWRGDSTYAIGSVTFAEGTDREEIRLMEGEGFPYFDHLGKRTPGASFNEMTRDIVDPKFDHFATDKKGDILVSDARRGEDWTLSLSKLGEPGKAPLAFARYLLHTKAHTHTTSEKTCHPHPFFSPDGQMVFFNSNASGTSHAYMARNLPSL